MTTFQYRAVGSGTWLDLPSPSLSGIYVGGPGSHMPGKYMVYRMTKKPFAVGVRFDVPNGQYEVRIQRFDRADKKGDDTYAEAFRSIYAEVLITARDRKWLDHAVANATGHASSTIMCDCEAGLDRYVGPGVACLRWLHRSRRGPRPRTRTEGGRWPMSETVWEIDRELSAIERSFKLLMLVSPVNERAFTPGWRTSDRWDDAMALEEAVIRGVSMELEAADKQLVQHFFQAVGQHKGDGPAAGVNIIGSLVVHVKLIQQHRIQVTNAFKVGVLYVR